MQDFNFLCNYPHYANMRYILCIFAYIWFSKICSYTWFPNKRVPLYEPNYCEWNYIDLINLLVLKMCSHYHHFLILKWWRQLSPSHQPQRWHQLDRLQHRMWHQPQRWQHQPKRLHHRLWQHRPLRLPDIHLWVKRALVFELAMSFYLKIHSYFTLHLLECVLLTENWNYVLCLLSYSGYWENAGRSSKRWVYHWWIQSHWTVGGFEGFACTNCCGTSYQRK